MMRFLRWSVDGSAKRAAWCGYVVFSVGVVTIGLVHLIVRHDPTGWPFLVSVPLFAWMPWVFAKAAGGD